MFGLKNQRSCWVRGVIGAALTATITSLTAAVQAQDFPTKPIRVVVPYPLGSSPDLVARIVSQHIPALAGQSMIVENRPGAGGVIGISELMRSPAGKPRLLAVVSGSRVKSQAAIPTVSEAAGLSGYDFGAPAGWVARSGTPRPVVEKIAGYIAKIAQYPDVAERAASFGLEMTPSTPDQLAERIRGDGIKMVHAVKIAGARAE